MPRVVLFVAVTTPIARTRKQRRLTFNQHIAHALHDLEHWLTHANDTWVELSSTGLNRLLGIDCRKPRQARNVSSNA